MSMKITVDFPGDTVTVSNAKELTVLAMALGVDLPERGRVSGAAVAKAVLAQGLTINDTQFLSAGMADGTTTGVYGGELKALRADYDARIQALKDAKDVAIAELRAKHGIKTGEAKAVSTGEDYEVTAFVPRVRKGEVVTNANGEVSHSPQAKTVVVTKAQVREHTDATRGRFSESVVVLAAAAVGQWVPVDRLGDVAKLLKDARVTKVPSAEEIAESA